MPLTWCGIFLGCLERFKGFKLQQTKELEPYNIKLTPQNKEPEAANPYSQCRISRSDEENKDLNSELAAYKKDLKVSNAGQRFEYWIGADKEKLEAKCSEMTTKKDELETQLREKIKNLEQERKEFIHILSKGHDDKMKAKESNLSNKNAPTKELEAFNTRLKDQKKGLEASNYKSVAQTKELEPYNIKLTSANKESEAANAYQRFEYWIGADKEKLEAKCSEMTTKKDELETQKTFADEQIWPKGRHVTLKSKVNLVKINGILCNENSTHFKTDNDNGQNEYLIIDFKILKVGDVIIYNAKSVDRHIESWNIKNKQWLRDGGEKCLII
ncbi:hypothetical protein Glove_420g26 [Diversispora epigaea]|uniref:Uncharacterized protein n=1 Tax=Diversispora epigaea TaxID=1348612 RepID=A0A397GWU2_9GLOM|nr:hypothetical protein Glove_420g26 [Diversispora epigaea]